jgi:hypothetical protein
MKRPLAALFVLLVVAIATGTAGAGDNEAGFKTSQAAMLTPLVAGSTVTPIISVGDIVGGYTFDSIPDGISFTTNGRGTMDVYVNHETSLVPFPANRSDFTNAMVSRLRLNQHSAGVLKGDIVIPSSANYQRFCSNFLVGPAQGSERELLLTNEEARDIVLRSGYAWHPPAVSLTEPSAEQAGVVVAYDVKSGAFKTIYGMGRHNHENDVGVPAYGHPVVLSGDDTFDAPASQLYMYSAASGAALWNDEGKLYAFVSDNPAVNDYGDFPAAESVAGSFVEVPRQIATGKNADGSEVTHSDVAGIPPPPAGIPDGPQWVLEYWSHNIAKAFQFIRIEDIAYDRNNPHVVYFADTGEPRAISDEAGRLRRGPSGTRGPYPNGRIFKMVLDANDPLKVTSLSLLANFDTGGYDNPNVPHQPDNVETTANSLLFQEDPGGHNQGAVGYAKIWRYTLPGGPLVPDAQVNQSARPNLTPGSWESSGIVDASAAFGPGAFLVDVQAHGFEIDTAPSPFPGVTYMREAGQLLLFRDPGS